MRIVDRKVGPGEPVWVCAEIGISHNGSLDIARQLIDVAGEAGCDAVKFQKRTVDVVYTPEELARPRESVFGATNGDLKRGLEFGLEEYQAIDRHMREHWPAMVWFASPWDVASVDFLESGFDVPAYKVASALVTNVTLLNRIAWTQKPVIMSTGMSSPGEIVRAEAYFPHSPFAVLACTAAYPAPLAQLHLRRIDALRRLWTDSAPVVGWSHHATGLTPALAAVALGASILEVHITLDRTMWGSDQAASLEPHALKKLVAEVRDLEVAMGSDTLGVLPCEEAVKAKLRRVG